MERQADSAQPPGPTEGNRRARAALTMPDMGVPAGLTDLALQLVFCLLAMTVLMRIADHKEKDIKLDLPKVAAGAPSASGSGTGVVITASGDVLLSGRKVELTRLAGQIAAGTPVRIKVDERAPSGKLVAVQDVLARAGITEIAVAVEEEKQ